jgi:class 3 adenylate cyclase/HAMP domain-containing protein
MVGMASYFLASSSVNNLAVEFFAFMGEEITGYADGQWNLLVEHVAANDPFMESAAKQAVENFSRSLLRSDTQSIFALDSEGVVVMNAGSLTLSEEERNTLRPYFAGEIREFVTVRLDTKSRVAYTFPFTPFGWQIFITEERSKFYGRVEQIFRTSLCILIGTLTGGACILVLVSRYLTSPIEAVVNVIKRVIQSNNLHETVPVYYNDEIGQMAVSFNRMLKILAAAYEQMKKYAFDAAVAQKREMKIRNVFQLYVPKDVIDEVFVNPEKMLTGNNREVSILFSDIRSFTTISESMTPDALVNSLNRYFSTMVNIIMSQDGVVDKYIGDAIMAIFGAPVTHENDSLASVIAGLEMMRALDEFNKNQHSLGAPEFHIGVGINYGIVTVGNIGCDKKMNYTVIGDAVNLASRLEGLTKKYKEGVLFAESVYEHIFTEIPCRLIDRVAVKGKTVGVPIFTARLALTVQEREGWKYHAEAADLYYNRRFQEALPYFEKAAGYIPEDPAAPRFAQRCRVYVKNPPPADWDGVEVMTEK